MTNPFATHTINDLIENPARPGTYRLKATPVSQGLTPAGDITRPEKPPYSAVPLAHRATLCRYPHSTANGEGEIRRSWYEPLKPRFRRETLLHR